MSNAIVPNSGKPKAKWVVPFKMGALEHIGVIPYPNTDWTVEIPLLGNYIAPDLTNFEKLVKKVENFVVENNLPFSAKNRTGPSGYAHSSAGLAAECLPTFPMDGKVMEACTYMLLGAWYIDDVCEIPDRKSMKDAKLEADILLQIFRKVWSGAYSSPDDLLIDENYSEALVQLYPAVVVWHYGQKLASESIPLFSETLKWFYIWYSKHVEAMRLLSQSKYTDNISISAFGYLRAPGFDFTLEFSLALAKVYPKPEVRNHALFGLLSSTMGLTSGIVNDLVSLGRDIAVNKKLNYILILAKEDGITEIEAINKAVAIIEKLVSDIEVTGDLLIEEFGSDPEVLKFYENMKNVWNASVTCYFSSSRYGNNVSCKPIKK